MSKCMGVLATLFLFIAIDDHALAANTCAPEDARLLGEAVALAHPYVDPEPLFDLVRDDDNKGKFSKTGAVIQCALRLSRALTKAGLESYDPKAYEKVMHPDVAQNMNALSVEMVTFGTELGWLAKVLPPIAEGDTDPFQTTGTPTRQILRQNLPGIHLMLQISEPYLRDAFWQDIHKQQEVTRQGIPLLVHNLK